MGTTANILFFHGEEDFLIQEKIGELKSQISDLALNLHVIEAEEPDLEKIVTALHSTSLLGGKRLVIIKEIDLKDQVWNKLIPYLKDVSTDTQVVFWAKKADKCTKLYKFCQPYEFKTFADWESDQVVAWIRRRVTVFNKNIEQQAAVELQQICGLRLRKLASEIDKLVTYIGDRQSITTHDVQTLASPGEISVFALTNALAAKNAKEALKSFEILYQNKTDLFRLLSLITAQYRIMLGCRSSGNATQVAQILKANPYFVKRCLESSSRFSEAELSNNLKLLLQTDLMLKSGQSQLTTFELLLANLCQK